MMNALLLFIQQGTKEASAEAALSNCLFQTFVSQSKCERDGKARSFISVWPARAQAHNFTLGICALYSVSLFLSVCEAGAGKPNFSCSNTLKCCYVDMLLRWFSLHLQSILCGQLFWLVHSSTSLLFHNILSSLVHSILSLLIHIGLSLLVHSGLSLLVHSSLYLQVQSTMSLLVHSSLSLLVHSSPYLLVQNILSFLVHHSLSLLIQCSLTKKSFFYANLSSFADVMTTDKKIKSKNSN